jgi:apolipoprotein N-acyltransferase
VKRAALLQSPPLFLSRHAPLGALLAGALTVFAFAPFGWWPLQIATLALLFRLASDQPPRRAALVGLAYGFGWTGFGVYWLFISMHTYGGMPSWMAALAVALMATVLGSFYSAALAAAAWLRRRCAIDGPLLYLALLPALWMLCEWARGWALTGFPWVVSGYAHSNSPLAGFAPLIGVYGMGGIAAVIAGSLALMSLAWPNRRALLLPALALLTLLFAGAALRGVGWTSPHGQPISVRLLQGNVPQDMKFADEHVVNTLVLYRDMIRAVPADLIATPETAMPLLSHRLPEDYLPRLHNFARESGSHIALGIPISDGPRQYANSVLGFAPNQNAPYRYDKHHLVPFGEFIPFGARWFVAMMNIPLGDFNRGKLEQPAFAVRDQMVLPNICYEDLFGEEIAAQIFAEFDAGRPQPTMLLNLSNIAWFGDSIALPQHLQISQLRALETGRPMLRATNTGATAVIGANGRLQTQLAPFTRGTLATRVQGYSGVTPYIRFGNALPVGLALLTLAAAAFLGRRRRPVAHNGQPEGKNR